MSVTSLVYTYSYSSLRVCIISFFAVSSCCLCVKLVDDGDDDKSNFNNYLMLNFKTGTALAVPSLPAAGRIEKAVPRSPRIGFHVKSVARFRRLRKNTTPCIPDR